MSSVRQTFGHGAASLEATRAEMGIARPASARRMSGEFPRDLVFDEPIITDVALGGHHTLTLRRDGTYRYQGHFRATGFQSFEVAIATTVGYEIPVPGGPPGASQLAFAAHGNVKGTNEFATDEERVFPWDQTGQLPLMADEWANVRRGVFNRRVEFDTNWFGVAGDAASFLGQVIVLGSTFGAAGIAIVLAGETASLLHFDGLVIPGTVGILLAAGAAFVFGPSVLIPVFLIGAAVTAALVRQRTLTLDEREFADRVFLGTLPMDRVRLTNLVGLGGRPFTCPGPGGTIIVNIGKGFDDPVRYTGKGGDELGVRAKGQLLIHELTHAWQIANESFTPAYYCRALSTALGTVGGNMSAYDYGPPDRQWNAFGTEEQASIVDEWFAGSDAPPLRNKAMRQRPFKPMDTEQNGNPYFRYLRDNIRTGIA
jgi:hypothetical protein